MLNSVLLQSSWGNDERRIRTTAKCGEESVRPRHREAQVRGGTGEGRHG